MAGGEGVRLRPLTLHTPKPLVPLLGKPVMGYAMDLLKAHGMRDVGVTLWYQPQKIKKAFGKGEKQGVKLKYFEEKEPLGTAGSVKLAEKELSDTFFVLSGDGLMDFDLTDAMRFHKEKGALATLLLKRVPIPLSYGVVMTDKTGRVTRFIEKPTWSRVFSDLVNTGTYILEPDIFRHIDSRGMPDFGKDVFPALVESGLPVYGYEAEGYWCDVGDFKAYMEAQRDLLAGKVRVPYESGVHESAVIEAGARVEMPCLIGENAYIAAGAVIRNAVIGEHCVIGPGAVIENACLWRHAEVQRKARVAGSVICDGAVVRQGAEIADGCAIGKQAVIGAYAMVRPGVRVWPHRKAAPGSVITRTLSGGNWDATQWSQRGAVCENAESVCDLCGAYLKTLGARRVITAFGGNASAVEAIAAGAMAASGAQVLKAGEMTRPMLKTLVGFLGLDGGVYALEDSLLFFQRQGRPLTAQKRSSIDACVLRQEMPPVFVRGGSLSPLHGAEAVYLSALVPNGGHSKALLSPVAVLCDNRRLCSLAEEALRRAGARSIRLASASQTELTAGETGFLLSESGEEVTVFTKERVLTPEEKNLLLAYLCYKQSGKLYEWDGLPKAAGEIAALAPNDDSAACLLQQTALEDGLAGMLLIAEALKHGSLEHWTEKLPSAHVTFAEVPCKNAQKGRLLRALCDQVALPYTLGEGIHISHEGGWADIVPDAVKETVRVTGESANSEFAKELCDFYVSRIQKILPPARERED